MTSKIAGALAACVFVFSGIAFAQNVSVTGANKGVSLKSLAGTETLVTIIIKETGAKLANQRVVAAQSDFFTVEANTPNRERNAFQYADVQEVQVQGGVVEAKTFKVDTRRALREEELKVVESAFSRARDIFQNANDNQTLRMKAAVLGAINREQDKIDYLKQLAGTNDLPTKIRASLMLYLAGDLETGRPLIPQGLESGSPGVWADSARLAGVLGDSSRMDALTKRLSDRSAEYCAPSARVLAKLDYRNSIGTLLRMISELNPEKAEAAIYALTRFGGDDVIQQLKGQLKDSTGENRYRIIRVLYALGDGEGKDWMLNEIMRVPTLQPKAAVILARDGNAEAMQFLRDQLKKPYDELLDPKLFTDHVRSRAEAACALIEGGDPTAVAALQELLRSKKVEASAVVAELVARMGMPRIIVITKAPIENINPAIAIEACYAAVSVGNNDFRQRFVDLLDMGWRR
jgi:HEAT repeat protein